MILFSKHIPWSLERRERHACRRYRFCDRSVPSQFSSSSSLHLHLHHFSKIKSQKESQNIRNQGSFRFLHNVEGSGSRAGSGSISLNSGSGSGRENLWIRIRIRIRSTARNCIVNCLYNFCFTFSDSILPQRVPDLQEGRGCEGQVKNFIFIYRYKLYGTYIILYIFYSWESSLEWTVIRIVAKSHKTVGIKVFLTIFAGW